MPTEFAVLGTNGIMDTTHIEFATALTTAYNNWVIEHWLERDPRLLTSIHVAPQDPQGAAREIERLGDHPRVVQVLLPLGQWAYGEPFYHPIFAAAARHHLVIGLHHSTAVTSALGQGRYYIEWHANVPQTAMATLTSLVCNGVFEKFPSLHFAVLESGWSWLPHLLWRFDQNYRSLHQEIPWVKQLPSTSLRERVKFSTQPTEDFSAQNWLRLIDMLETDRLFIFATDYPHWDFDSPDASIPHRLPSDLKQHVVFRDIAKIFAPRYRQRTLLAVAISMTQSMEYYALNFYLPTISLLIFGKQFILAIIGSAFFNLFGILGGSLNTVFLPRWGVRRVAIIGYIGGIVALLFIGGFGKTLPVALAGAGIALFIISHGFGPGGAGMTISALSFPTAIRGIGTGFTQSLLRVGSTMGFYFFPLLLAAVGLYPTLLLLAIVPLIGLVVTLIIKWDPVLQNVNVDEEETQPVREEVSTGIA